MVFSKKKYKMLKKLVGIMIIEYISSNLHSISQPAVAHKFNAVRNMALHYFRPRYAGRFANMRF